MGIRQIWLPKRTWWRTLEDRCEENGYTPADDQCFQDVDADPERFAVTEEAKTEQEDRGLDSSEERTIEYLDTINDLGNGKKLSM